MEIIKNRAINPDPWTHLSGTEDAQPDQWVTITLDQYLSDAETWDSRTIPWGLRLPSHADLDTCRVALNTVELVTIDFPKFTDGRGYSLARSVRRAGYSKELRATGDVLQDQISFMERCGFDAFQLKPGKSLSAALEAFGELGQPYQSAADGHAPGWRRTAASTPTELV